MSHPRPAQPAKLVVSVLLGDKGRLPQIAATMQEMFGALDMISPWMDFHYTKYYQAEMGALLFRRIFAFKHLVSQSQLAFIKRQTNEVEQSLALDGRRCVNIDPGYLLNERFVLATGKNYAHRIYIGQGIYADLTLVYQKGRYQPLQWTYPDYQADDMQAFLIKVRKKYGADLTRGVHIRPATEHPASTGSTHNNDKGEKSNA